MKPIAIVIPWFGKELKGGAEQHAFQVATRLAERGRMVEVLTTCCRSFSDDWSANHYKQGAERIQGVTVRRFRVDRRNSALFDQANRALLSLKKEDLIIGGLPVSSRYAEAFVQQNIHSSELRRYLADNREAYQAFLFLPYLYGVVIDGLPIVAEKAFLQPCLHDEAYAYLPEVQALFYQAKGVLFLSAGEMALAQKLYGPGFLGNGLVVGAGVEHGAGGNSILKNGLFDSSCSRFLLCLGRRDQTKNTDFLVTAFQEFRQQNPQSELWLVLAGPGLKSYQDESNRILDFQLVSEEEKQTLLSSCTALFHPSENESYSRVIMEAWFCGKPVVVHQNCLATATAVKQACGGHVADSRKAWALKIAEFESMDSAKMERLGENGRRYAMENANWDKILGRYEAVLDDERSESVMGKNRIKGKEIHQLLPNLAYGDAISNHALEIRDYLRASGYQSNIYVRYLDPKMASEAGVYRPGTFSKRSGIIYHHSIGSELTMAAVKHSGPKLLIYHNITPDRFFENYDPEYARVLKKGRADLASLASNFQFSAGDSTYNAEELQQAGFLNPAVLPICVNPDKWKLPADAQLMSHLQDGVTNILFTGRIAPNKCQHHLVESFYHYLTMDPKARLILVGSGQPADPYYQHVKETIAKYNLARRVFQVGQVTEAELQAYYRTAHLFWSMSEHEGFCIPVIESMWFDIPVLAYKSSAVPETIGEGGLLFTSKEDMTQIAALAKLMVHDTELRDTVLKAQRKRRQAFLPEAVWPKLEQLIENLELA